MSNSQLNKLKSGIKYGIQVTPNLSSNVVGDSNDEINFPHELLLAGTKVSKIRKFLQVFHQLTKNFRKRSGRRCHS